MNGKRLAKEWCEPRFRTFLDRAADAVNPQRNRRALLKRYGLALGLAGLALFLRGVLPIPEASSIYQLPVAAVVLSAWYGGRGQMTLACQCPTLCLAPNSTSRCARNWATSRRRKAAGARRCATTRAMPKPISIGRSCGC